MEGISIGVHGRLKEDPGKVREAIDRLPRSPLAEQANPGPIDRVERFDRPS